MRICRASALPSLLLLPLAALTLALPACDGGSEGRADEELGSVVPPGKADDFFSPVAQEYAVEGRTTLTLDASWAGRPEAEQLAEVRRLIPYKQVVIGWFLNRYMVDKDSHDGDDAYGGFKALTKNGSYEDGDLAAVDGEPLTWAFTFRQELGGQLDLIKALPDARAVDGETWAFDLWIGRVDNATMQELDTDHEWYRRSPWSSFAPDKVGEAQKELLPLTLRAEPRSDDAWIDTGRLFADGRVTVGVHFGWDYHGAYHEKHSKAVYDWLVAKGFSSPVGAWADLRHDAGPLTGTITYAGREIAVEVSLFWGRTGDATDPDTAAGGRQLEADMLESLATREVVIYSGHSGPFYGFALANWRKTSEGDLDDSELMEVPLNEGAYQVIVAEGCDTYALGQAFFLNPSKPGLVDLDVVTTTSFSNAGTAGTVLDVLGALLGKGKATRVDPVTWARVLEEVEGNSYWFTTMYGVHGIDDNPAAHPLADPAVACAACGKDADCGAGARCVKLADGERGCAVECTATRGCGGGETCRDVQVGGWLSYRACVPESLSCAVPAEEPVVLVLNEILADPAPGAAGDANGDGTRDGREDEFVEIVNASAREVDLAGWTLADGVGLRHAFPAGTVLAPGGAIVVFGGGAPAIEAGTALVQVASTGGLGLNNAGDAVRLADPDGVVAAEASWGAEGGEDLALARATDGDPAAAWLPVAPTPGVRADGSPF